MPGVRIDRFLASTAIVLLLSATMGGALAEPKSGVDDNAAGSAPGATTPAAPTAAESGHSQAEPAGSTSETAAATVKPAVSTDQPIAIAKPAESTDQAGAAAPAPVAAGKPAEPIDQPATAAMVRTSPATPGESADQPAAASVAPTIAPGVAPDSGQPAEQPATAAATEPPAVAQPAAATGGDEVPTATATAAPAATPTEPAATSAQPAATPTEPAATSAQPAATPNAAAPTVTAAAPTADVVVDANAPIADQLRELVNGKYDRIVGGKKERASLDAFYSSRNYAPLWISDGKVNGRAKAAMAYLGQVDTDGLDPADYPVPDFSAVTDPSALAEAELRLTTSVVRYAHHASVGRVHWTRVSGDISYDQKPPSPAEVLAAMADAKDVGEALATYEPQHPAYLALKAKLAELRAGKEAARTAIPNGPALKIGMQDARVPQLRTRLGVAGGSDTTYDKTLAEAVKRFQQEHELKATAMLTSATLEALNGRLPERPIDTIIANLERWRWMPHDLGKTYVIVNLPDFTLRVMHDGKQLWMTKIVEGKPNMPTPIMSAEMKYITVNPTWNVPPSIVAREYMPALQQDPTVLERMGLKVSTNPDGTVHIAQPPGEQNALGRLRFNFPNKFLVYQHDTPNKNLFAFDKRAFSHGCMRVQDPAKYAEVLLSIVRPGEGYTEDRIRRMFGQSEVDIQFPKFVPVHLTYQTAFVDEDGKLEFRDDLYGRDKALLAILKSDERKVADIPIERKENSVRREALAMPESGGFFGGRSYYPNGGNFFTQLFGGPSVAPPPAPAPRKRSAQRPTQIQ